MSYKDNHGYSKYHMTPRKVFDNTIDNLKLKNSLLKGDIRDAHREIRRIIEFLENGPHANAWKLFNSED